MNSKECEEQLKSLVEAWDLDEACLNQTDIEAMKHLMLENQIQQDTIKTQKLVIGNLSERITKSIDLVKKIKLHYQQSPTMIPSVEIDKLEEILKGVE